MPQGERRSEALAMILAMACFILFIMYVTSSDTDSQVDSASSGEASVKSVWLDGTLAPELQECDSFGFHFWPESHQWELGRVVEPHGNSPFSDTFRWISDPAPDPGIYSIAIECIGRGLIWEVDLLAGQSAEVYLSFADEGYQPIFPVARYTAGELPVSANGTPAPLPCLGCDVATPVLH